MQCDIRQPSIGPRYGEADCSQSTPRRLSNRVLVTRVIAVSEGKQSMEYSLDQLRELLEILRTGKVGEFEFEDERLRLRINLGTAPAPQVSVAVPAPTAAAAPLAPAAMSEVASADVVFVTSPFVGTFYRSPSPEAAPFATPGQTISKGQTLCIVEAMKLMNEIESDVTGTLLEVLVENGSNVEFGQRLFKVRKAQAA